MNNLFFLNLLNTFIICYNSVKLPIFSLSLPGFTECSFNESEETLCFAAAGKSLLFYMLNRNFVDLRLLKDGPSRIFKTVNGLVVIDGPYINRANYFKNGTLKLTNVSKKDDGVYTLEEYASDGKKLRTPIVHLKVLGKKKTFVYLTVI